MGKDNDIEKCVDGKISKKSKRIIKEIKKDSYSDALVKLNKIRSREIDEIITIFKIDCQGLKLKKVGMIIEHLMSLKSKNSDDYENLKAKHTKLQREFREYKKDQNCQEDIKFDIIIDDVKNIKKENIKIVMK